MSGHETMLTEMDPREITLGRAGRWVTRALVVALIGLVATVALIAGGSEVTERFYRSYLVNFMFFLSLALGGLFFVLITHLVRAAWSVVLRRMAEVLAMGVLPLTAVALVILFGMHDLYEWSHPNVVAADPLLQHKAPWLNPTFFTIRFVFYFAVWNFLAFFFLRNSVRQDTTRDHRLTMTMERVAAPGMIFFAMTVTFAVFDFVMSLYPHWYSTIYGVYYFAGCVLGFFALVSIMTHLLHRAGKLTTAVSVAHSHDVGKMLFAFVVFWAYIAFSQFMLIWYANLPEETAWYQVRQSGGWVTLSLILVFGHFFVPFLWLMSRHMKRNPLILTAGACWLLAMHWLDLYYLIMPESSPDGPAFHLLDFSCFLLIGGTLAAFAFWRLGKVNLIPVGDPRLEESMGLEHA